MAVSIHGVAAGSPAERAGIQPGMQLVALDGHAVRDGLDYEFYSPPAKLCVVCRQGEEERTFAVEKDEYEPLGCLFESYLIDGQHTCRNACVFCFIDQMPKGLRDSLYFKDDDERLGFLFGNYVTLTNLSQAEVDRIIEMRISPVNISVHTANPDLRVTMMKNKRAGEVLAYIGQLAEAGIALNTQLVLCPGLNDGEELRRSIEWLAGFAPAMQSIAAVPVGLTKYREGLSALRPYTGEEAAAQLDMMLEYGDRYEEKLGSRLVYPSDEWFLLAGRDIPPAAFYEDFPQLENGVGMWRLLEDEFCEALEEMAAPDPALPPPKAHLATGVLAAPLLQRLAGRLAEKWPGSEIEVHTVENGFFGPLITVAGLLTGQDVVAALRGRVAGRLLLPGAMLRAEGDLFLDGFSPDDVEEALGLPVHMVPGGGGALLDALLGLEGDD